MPGGDGTGPMGMGPMTGRGAGYCAGYATPGYVNPAPGGRFGQGRRGGGRGRRNQFYATGLTGWQRAAAGQPAFGQGPAGVAATDQTVGGDVAAQEVNFLKQQLTNLTAAIEDLKTRIDGLQQTSEAE